mmetsp:Transcript_28700/g.48422  ORF Transcript_28700/g.48422 Transcript_28700/m.48422 type:complete len:235 (-) Transcript_28700:236-940(-)
MPSSSLIVAALLLSPLVTATTSTDPVATSWPLEFSINFETNITTDMNTLITPSPVSGVSYYNWNLRAQRIEHGAGAYECTNFYNTDQPCTLFFLAEGLYRVLASPLPEGQEECCLDMPGIGPSPPDWVSKTRPSYNGDIIDMYSTLLASKWTFDTMPNTTNPHMYEEVSADEPSNPSLAGRPLYFSFPAVEGRQDFHYDPFSMLEEPQPASLFALPEGCEGLLCSSSTKSMRLQ